MNNLKRLRERNGLSQAALAHRLGVSQQAIAKWEASGIYPRGERIMKLANILHCTIDQLYGREPPDGGEGSGQDSA